MKELYICSECSYKSSKWLGKCLECEAWNSFEPIEHFKKKSGGSVKKIVKKDAHLFSDVKVAEDGRLSTDISEFDRVLGGGLVEGSVVLLSGKPGIGKSTLLLQVLDKYSKKMKVLYVAGEESAAQVKGRGNRLGVKGNFYILPEVNVTSVRDYIEANRPKVVVIDSIQTLYNPDVGSIPGTISQIREVSLEIVRLAKDFNISFLVVGHITKDGKIAGPKLLEHMVDTVLEFEGEEEAVYRVLRATKNRYGSVNEIGIFNMDASGINGVTNPSEYFLEGRGNAAGSVVVPVLEGNRVLLVEVQSLVSNAIFGMPRRLSQGIDGTKVQMLAAVIEKQAKVNLTSKDIFFNIPGGVASKDTALGLGIVFSLISSYKETAIAQDVAVMGEVGLTGEVRKVPFALKRAKELEKIGFKKIYAPAGNAKELSKVNIKVQYLENIFDLVQRIN